MLKDQKRKRKHKEYMDVMSKHIEQLLMQNLPLKKEHKYSDLGAVLFYAIINNIKKCIFYEFNFDVCIILFYMISKF